MTDTCWSCGAPHEPRRPHRDDYPSEPAYLVAALTWLDYKYPKRVEQRERIAEWKRLEMEADAAYVVARIRELLAIDEWDDALRAEGDRLMAIHLENRRRERAAGRTKTNQKKEQAQ